MRRRVGMSGERMRKRSIWRGPPAAKRGAFEEAGVLLREAVGRDGGYAGAHAVLAGWLSLRVFQGWSADRGADMAALLAAARTAIALDPAHGRALALLGHSLVMVEGRHDEALRLFERAAAAAPNDPEALGWSVPTLAYAGDGRAVGRAELALRLTPEDPFLFRYQSWLGLAHYAAGDCEAAAAWGRRSDASNPNYSANLRVTAAALAALGRREEAAGFVARHRALEPGFRVSEARIATFCGVPALAGRFARDYRAAGLMAD